MARIVEPPSLEELGQALGPVRDLDRLGPLVDERVLEYPLGSGQAEELALYAGLKPMVRQTLEPEYLEPVIAEATRRGLEVGLAPGTFVRGSGGIAPGTGPGSFRIAYVGHRRDAIREAIVCEERRDDRTLGLLLGYPECCVDAFFRVPRPRPNLDVCAASWKRTRGRPEPRLNVLDLHLFHYLSWYPCTFDCPRSLAYANDVVRHATKRHPDFIGAVEEVLGTHRLMLHDDVQLSLRGPWHDGEVEVREVWPTARHRHPRSPVDPAARPVVARLLERVEEAGRVGVVKGALRLDGKTVRGIRGAVLIPFGA